MEALSDGTDFQDFFELDNMNEPSGDVEMQETDDNAHDTTDDAIETILMAESESAVEKKTVSSGISVASRVFPTSKAVVNIPHTKVVMASQPIQVLTQEKPGTVVTKYILKKPSSSATSVSSGAFTISGPTRNKATTGMTGLQTLTIPVQRNSLTLSPAKGGFKIPPLKNPLKVSMVPSNSHSVRTINLSTSIDNNDQATVQSNPNFQFQTLVTQHNKPVNISNTQIITQNLNNQPSIPRLQCVRLVPAGNPQNSTTSGIPVANLLAAHGNTNTLPVGTTIMQQPRLQQILNVQALQKPVQQQLKSQRLIMPATTVQPAMTNLSPGSLLQAGNVGYAMVPAKYVEQLKKQLNSQLYNTEPSTSMSTEPSHPVVPVTKVAVNGKVRKPCNCTKSMCLKLYCECFANGHFCDGCNCINCHNNLEFDGDRSKAIKSCLERNPMAFRPKIGRGRDDNRTHQKGCNCKRSGCLKNYCECYEARILCTSRCKCIGCKNIEEDGVMNSEHHPLMNLADAADVRRQQQAAARKRINSHLHQIRPLCSKAQSSYSNPGEKLPCTFFTREVIEATCTCMLAQAEEAEKTNRSIQVAEMMVLEEFGKCLMQIIQAAGKAKSNSNP